MTILRSLRTTFSRLTSWLADTLGLKGHTHMPETFDNIASLLGVNTLDGTEQIEAISNKNALIGGLPNARITIAQIVAYVLASLGVGAKAVTDVAGTAYTAVSTDAARWMNFTSGTAVTLTIDGNNTYPADAEIEFSQGGAGAVTPTGANGVTILVRGAATATAGQNAVAMLKRKGSSNNWIFTGDIA
jgi:hypothetical protein